MSPILFPRRGTEATLPDIMANYGHTTVVPGLEVTLGNAPATERSLISWLTGRARNMKSLMAVKAVDIVGFPETSGGSGTVGQTMIPVMFERLLRSHGIDPRAYAVLSLMHRESIGIADATIDTQINRRRCHADPQDYAVHLEPGYTVRPQATLCDGTTWKMDVHVIDLPHHLPLTLMNGLVGQSLGRLVSHPLLDMIDVTICDVFHDGDCTTVYYEHEMTRIRLDDIEPLV